MPNKMIKVPVLEAFIPMGGYESMRKLTNYGALLGDHKPRASGGREEGAGSGRPGLGWKLCYKAVGAQHSLSSYLFQ